MVQPVHIMKTSRGARHRRSRLAGCSDRMTPSSRAGSRPRIGWKPFLYDPTVASVRLRSLLPCKYLESAGFHTTIVPADGSGSFDCVVFQKAYEHHDIALAERLAARGVRIVFDLCDNHFWNPDDDPVFAERAARLRRMIDLADAVTVSTPELVEWVAPQPAAVVDDVVEVPRTGALARCARSTKRLRRRVGLVWFGNAGSERWAVTAMSPQPIRRSLVIGPSS
jgi:hypothetical protein